MVEMIVCHVPRKEALAAVDPAGADSSRLSWALGGLGAATITAGAPRHVTAGLRPKALLGASAGPGE